MAKQQATTPSQELNAQTLNFLGITQQPFTTSILTGDAIYSDTTRDQMLATLKHHMQFSELVLIVEGEQGSGKTTLFRQLVQDNIPNLYLMSIIAEPTDTLVQLQQKMAVHLKGQGSANYLDQDLKNLQVFDQFPIVILDDAHVLSDTTMQELVRYRSQLKRDKATNLKILLFANPGMAKTLEDISDLQHNELYVQQMPELTPKQVQAFIDHRLAKAGYRGSTILSPDTIHQIHKKSRGKPGQVMTLATLMLEKHLRNLNHPAGNPHLKIFGVAGVVLSLAAGLYFWFSHAPASKPPITITEADEPARNTESVTAQAAPEPTETNPGDAPAQTLLPDKPTQPGAPPAEIIATETIANAAQPVTPATPPADLSSSGIAPPLVVAPIETKSNPKISNPAIAAPPVAPPVTLPAPTQTDSPTAVAAAEPKPALIPDTKPVVIENKQTLTKLAQLGIKDSEWLRKQNPAYWTLQLMGAHDTDTVLKFALEHKLGDDCAWYATRLNGKPWYVLVHRFYTSADIARKGLELLPPDLQRGQPWVKSVAAIHKDLAR